MRALVIIQGELVPRGCEPIPMATANEKPMSSGCWHLHRLCSYDKVITA